MKKIKKTKKVSRETSKKRVSQPKSQELVIKVQQMPSTPTVAELSEPMTGKGRKLTIPKTWVSAGQLNQILQVTPRQYVYQKPGKGGGKFDYVTTSYVTKALNYIFGWNWDFDVLEHGIEGGQVWVKGKLTVRGTDQSQTIVKTQFGRNDIKMKKSGGMLDFGNDMKGAASDALKKCASMLGIASDIYGKADFKYEAEKEPAEASTQPPVATSKPATLKEGQVMVDGSATYVCKDCGLPISEAEYNYSMKMFKKPLCREDQPKKK